MPDINIEFGVNEFNRPIIDTATIRTSTGDPVEKVIEAAKKIEDYITEVGKKTRGKN